MTKLPLKHFQKLQKLAKLRRVDITEAVVWLCEKFDGKSEATSFNKVKIDDEYRSVNLLSYRLSEVVSKIEQLPNDIRPVTDGPYCSRYKFFDPGRGLIGIETDDVRIVDFEMSSEHAAEHFISRVEPVFKLVLDLFPSMTLEQYRLYTLFNSQYLRILNEPDLFTIPRSGPPSVDVGAYVGYKALALSRASNGVECLAIEMAAAPFELLQRNAAINPELKVKPVFAGVSSKRQLAEISTIDPRSMGNSLTSFSSLEEFQSGLSPEKYERGLAQEIETRTLDELTGQYDRIGALHISVNGHEPEVIQGGHRSAGRSDIIRVSCPMMRDGVAVKEMVIDELRRTGVSIFGRSGGAIVAGREVNSYHHIPIG